jgi:serine/threonine protein kinase
MFLPKLNRHVEALNAKGDVFFSLNQYEEALYNNPNNLNVLNNMGALNMNLNNHKAAELCFDKVLRSDPDHISALFNKGIYLLRYDPYNFDEAISYFDKALHVDPDFTEALIIKVWAVLNLRYDVLDAISTLKQIARINANLSTSGGFGQVIICNATEVFKITHGLQSAVLYHETAVLRSVQCDNVIKYISHQSDHKNNMYWFVITMSKADTTLKHLIKNNKLTHTIIPHIIRGLLTGLNHIHSKGIVHCDIKPANIGLMEPVDNDASVKILDLGGAVKMIGEKTRANAFTSLYSCPEIANRGLTASADLFAAGLVLQKCLVQVCSNGPVVQENGLEQVIAKACHSNATLRYKNAEDMLQDFETAWEQFKDCTFNAVQVITYNDTTMAMTFSQWSETVFSDISRVSSQLDNEIEIVLENDKLVRKHSTLTIKRNYCHISCTID